MGANNLGTKSIVGSGRRVRIRVELHAGMEGRDEFRLLRLSSDSLRYARSLEKM